jgi:poly(3-hydroxybutyrate) depolymerase/thiol-disulfide isomerase/thioredoxin
MVIGLSVVAASWFLVFRWPPDIRAFWSVEREWQQAPRGKLSAPSKERLAGRCLEIGRKYPGTVGGLSAQLLAATLAADTDPGRDAHREFERHLGSADVGVIADMLDRRPVRWEALAELAPAILARVRRSPDHPRIGRLLAAVCAATKPQEGQEPPPIYTEAADLIAARYADSPDIYAFCESIGLFPGNGCTWAIRFERHLRAILQENRDRAVRCHALMALAVAIQSAPDDRQAEAEALYEQFCMEFDGKQQYPFQGIEQMFLGRAQDQLRELRFRAVGMPASEIAGIDLDGRMMALSEYRGRVVLLNFWATWCYPCMKLIPHERDLATRFAGQPFDIVGVNCDQETTKARDAVVKNDMTWRSFRNQVGDARSIAGDWNVIGYPTLYLIDHHGIIRKRWIGGPSPEVLARMTETLIDAARRKLSPDAIHTLLATMPESTSPKPASEGPAASAPSHPGAGFVDKVYRDADGSESKYVVFVPPAYDGAKPFPAILYLHGSGARGSDGRSHLGTGLAKAIRQRSEGFPFLTVFPQAREDENWTAESSGGKRALAILDRVASEYRLDPNRVVLTGVSMGGQGTWSLAASRPDQWSAIVPICHGGETKTAARLTDLPCWCFHGDADRMIPAEQSREMIRAIQAAGGHPLYQELARVDHNDSADRVYAMPELYEWLLLQDRSKRSR